MKFWNKNKRAHPHWTKVSMKGWQLRSDPIYAKAKHWCQTNGSTGRFYAGPYDGIWYFENAQDATLFVMFWLHQ